MKVALIGYGKMGKIIDRIAQERGHEVVARFNSSNPLNEKDLSKCDVAIDFTRPDSALTNIKLALKNQVSLVVGTTGWYEHLDEVEKWTKNDKGSLFWASNFSIGVNIFFELNERLAQLMANQDYQVLIEEIHHTEKLDAPSGTAISIAKPIIKSRDLEGFQTFENESAGFRNQNLNQKNLPIYAQRQENVPGTHTVVYESDVDMISFEHKAKSREGFALGAVIAAEYLNGKTGFFTMKDILKF